MSLLTGKEIHRQVMNGNIKIEPFDPKRLNPNSYNLRLSNKLLVYAVPAWSEWERRRTEIGQEKNHVLDMAKATETCEVTIPEDGFVLMPGRLYLASTMEYTETPCHAPYIEGRSSVGRLGLSVHATAGFGDVGFCGDWTLELSVIHPVRVFAGVEICQIAYSTVEGTIVHYAGRYKGQRGPKASGMWKDFQKPEEVTNASGRP